MNALNIYQLNIYQNLSFMHRLKNDSLPKIFRELLRKRNHKYPKEFSKNSDTSKPFPLSNIKYCILVQGPKLWNDFFVKQRKGNNF